MSRLAIAVLFVVIYLVAVAVIGLTSSRRAAGVSQYMHAGARLGPVLVGALMMSEYIGISTVVGTADLAQQVGLSASWNLFALVIAFLLLGLFFAARYRKADNKTVSGLIGERFGPVARLLTSVIMIVALTIITVSAYVGAGATLAPLLGVSTPTAALIAAAATLAYLVLGGMFAVAATNAMDAVLVLGGLLLTAIVSLVKVGGWSGFTEHSPHSSLTLNHIGLALVLSWVVSNIGAVCSSQLVIQAVNSTRKPEHARNAAFLAAILVVPVGLLAAFVGLAVKDVFPSTGTGETFGTIATHTNPWLGGLIVAGLGAAFLGAVGGTTHAVTSLVLRDFYTPLRKKMGWREHSLREARISNAVVTLIPLPFALGTPGILSTLFFARGIRIPLVILMIVVFFLPKFGSARGAVGGMVAAIIGTTIWYLLDNPFGVDSSFIALGLPVVILLGDHYITKAVNRGRRRVEASTVST